MNLTEIPQQDLIDNVENWSFINFTEEEKQFVKTYKKNSEDIKCYYQHDIAEKRFGDRFWFDGGLNYEDNDFTDEICDFEKIDLNTNKFTPKYLHQFISKDKLTIPQGSQGVNVFNQKYKIIWNCRIFGNIYFTDKNIIVKQSKGIISSNNKKEMLFLFSILNSNITKELTNLISNIKTEHLILVATKDIKKYIRPPLINSQEQQDRKQKVIELTEQMLELDEQEQYEARDKIKEEIDKIITDMYGL